MPQYKLKHMFLGTTFVSFMLWILVLSLAPLAILYGVFYFAIQITVGWSAIKHREPDWWAGVLYSALSLSIPLWVFGAFWLCQYLHFF